MPSSYYQKKIGGGGGEYRALLSFKKGPYTKKRDTKD